MRTKNESAKSNVRKNRNENKNRADFYFLSLDRVAGWPRRPVRAAGSRSDKKPRPAGSKARGRVPESTPQLRLNRHGAASCRFATRPVLRTRPGHPDLFVSGRSRGMHLKHCKLASPQIGG